MIEQKSCLSYHRCHENTRVYSSEEEEILIVRWLPGLLVRLGVIRILVVGDLHIGFERELAMRGIHPISQWKRFLNNIAMAGMKLRTNTLVILGDLKHDVIGGGRRELAEASMLLRKLKVVFERIIVTRGNHDSLLRDALEDMGVDEIEFKEARGFSARSIYFMHGHAIPGDEVARSKVVLLAHAHPVLPGMRSRVLVKGDVQLAGNRACFFIIPAMSYLVPGLDYRRAIDTIPLLRRNRALITDAYTIEG